MPSLIWNLFFGLIVNFVNYTLKSRCANKSSISNVAQIHTCILYPHINANNSSMCNVDQDHTCIVYPYVNSNNNIQPKYVNGMGAIYEHAAWLWLIDLLNKTVYGTYKTRPSND